MSAPGRSEAVITGPATTNRFGSDVDADTTPADPMELARLWVGHLSGEERPLMTLATVDADGFPDARHVLLSGVGAETFTFHTDGRSRKVAELEADPRVALAVVWREELRQLAVQGTAVPARPEAAAAAYAARSSYLKLLAWHNDDVLAARPAAERRRSWARAALEHPEGTLVAPPWWRGFDVVPHRVVFWRGDEAGPSNRVEYVRGADGTWAVTRRAG